MKSHLRARARPRPALTAVPPPAASADYSPTLAAAAASILYRSPLPSAATGRAVYVLNAAALPDAAEVDYDALLPYVLARLPGEDDLVGGAAYEVVFFAGAGGAEGPTAAKRTMPGWGWFFQAYHVLTRAMRKRIQKLYIVHERTWVRVLAEMFSTVVSPKFRKKIVHGKNSNSYTDMI
jgi:Rho GTPase-activating protein 1